MILACAFCYLLLTISRLPSLLRSQKLSLRQATVFGKQVSADGPTLLIRMNAGAPGRVGGTQECKQSVRHCGPAQITGGRKDDRDRPRFRKSLITGKRTCIRMRDKTTRNDETYCCETIFLGRIRKALSLNDYRAVGLLAMTRNKALRL